MKKALLLVAVLGMVASASASVEIFFSKASDGYGLTDPSKAFTISGNDGYDAANYLLLDKDASGGVSAGDVPAIPAQNIIVDPGETVYVWLKFNGESNNRKISGLSFKCNEVVPEAMAFYRLADGQGDWGLTRWQSTNEQLTGTMNDDPNNPFDGPGKIYMIAVDVAGLVNASSNTQPLWVGGTAPGTRTALLGALKFAEPGRNVDYTFGFADEVNTIDYAGDYANPTVNFGGITVTPEPASMILLGLAGLFLRRR